MFQKSSPGSRGLVLLTAVFALSTLAATGCREVTVKPQRFSDLPAGHTERIAYLPSGEQLQSVLMVRKVAPKTVRAGEEFEYTIEVYNPTDKVVLKNVVIRDYIDPNVRLRSASPNWTDIDASEEKGEYIPDHEERKQWRAGKDLDDIPVEEPVTAQVPMHPVYQRVGFTPEIRWYVEELFPEKVWSTRVRARALSGEQEQLKIINCASATYEIAACVASKVVAPELRLGLELPTEYEVCATDEMKINYRVRNAGSGTAQDVVVTTDLPEGIVAPDGGQTVRWNAGDISSNQSKKHKVNVHVRQAGQYTISARAESQGELTAEAQSARLRARKSDLKLTLKGPEDEYVNLAAYYEISVENTGNAPLRDLQVRARLPRMVECINASHDGAVQDRAVAWQCQDLPPGKTLRLSMRLRGSEAATGRVMVSAEAVCTGEKTKTLVTNFEGVPAMVVEVVDTKDPNKVGQNEVYQLRVKNQGSAPENDVVLRVQLEEAMTFVSAQGTTQTRAKTGAREITFQPVQSLAPGEVAEWHLTTRCLKEGDIRIHVRVDSEEHARPVRETEATRIYK